MASNINPSLTPVNSLDNFRFWCQKVLPLVYDDSLSYYEVLGKMVVQLNDVIDNVNADTENVLTLKDAFLELQTYVNNFFDDIDQLASYAERAEAAQTAANTSAINAASSASNASASSLAAMNARDAANSAKQAAETSANTASKAATNANTKASEAAQSAITAQTAQTSASQSATLAATDRSAAQTAASTATTKANEANTSATNAETSAENAAQSEANAEGLVNNIQENLDNIQQNTQGISELKESISNITEDKIEWTPKTGSSCNVLEGGYIRSSADSSPGHIFGSAGSNVLWFQVTEDTLVYYESNVSGIVVGISDKEPVVNNNVEWATKLINGSEGSLTPETATLVPANYYIACSRYKNPAPEITFYLSVNSGEVVLKSTLPLTTEMSEEVDEKIDTALNDSYVYSLNGAKVVSRINKSWGQSACIINDKIVSFTAGYDTEPINGNVYVYNKTTMDTIRSFAQQLGHCPCADYNEETDTIITTGAGGAIRPTSIYLIKNAAQIIENGTDIEYGINAVEIVFERPCLVCFAETSDYIYAIASGLDNSNWRYDLKKYAYKIKLGKGNNDLVSQYAEDSFGTFISGCGENEYNGTAHIEARFEGSFAIQFQGAKYYGGKMLLPCDVMVNNVQKSCILLVKFLANGKIKIADDYMVDTIGNECQDVIYFGDGIYATRSSNQIVKFQMFL